MVDAIRYDTPIHEARSTLPVAAAIAGNAVATMVWSTTARNIGSMIDGKIARNLGRAGPGEAARPGPRSLLIRGPGVGLVNAPSIRAVLHGQGCGGSRRRISSGANDFAYRRPSPGGRSRAILPAQGSPRRSCERPGRPWWQSLVLRSYADE